MTDATDDAPLLIADDDNWHSMHCARVRDSEVTETNVDVAERDHCHVCGLFVDTEVAQ